MVKKNGILQKFFKGRTYKVSSVCFEPSYSGYYIIGEIPDNIGSGYWFEEDDSMNVTKYNNFSSYFTTIAEWREKQINSILND